MANLERRKNRWTNTRALKKNNFEFRETPRGGSRYI